MVQIAKAAGLYSQGKSEETGLTKNQTVVLEMLTGTGEDGRKYNQMQVADALGVSRQRIRQIVEDLLDKGHKIPGVRKRGETVGTG